GDGWDDGSGLRPVPVAAGSRAVESPSPSGRALRAAALPPRAAGRCARSENRPACFDLQVVPEADRVAPPENVVNVRVRLARLAAERTESGHDGRIDVEQVRDATEYFPTAAVRPILAEGYAQIRVQDRIDAVVADRDAFDVTCVV